MSTILTTVEGYEDQVLDFVKNAKAPVVEYVAKGVELVGDRLPRHLPRLPPDPHRGRRVAGRLRQEADRRQHRDRHRRPRDRGPGGRLRKPKKVVKAAVKAA